MEATAPSTSVQFSLNKEADDNLTYQLVDALTPGNSIICVSFVTAREVEGNNIEHLKASMAEYLSQYLQTPVRQVDLSIEVLPDNSMAASVKANGPALVEEAATPPAGHDTGDESTNDAAPAKAKNKVPRPPNAFILYRKDWHPIVVAQNPGLHNNAISVIIGKKWKNESHEIRDKYQLKAAEAKHQHLIANPGYQYQPRKPSEKKKRMTKNKLAKLAARSAAAKSSTSAHLDAAATVNEDSMAMPQVTPLLNFNENKSMFSFQAAQGTTTQLTAEMNDYNNSKWSAAQQASYLSGMVIPASYSTETTDDSVNMEMVAHNPPAANTTNFVADDTDDFDESAEEYFDEFAERDIPLPAFEDVDVILPEIDGLATCEVFRQIGLNEEFKDDLNDFFDFNAFR